MSSPNISPPTEQTQLPRIPELFYSVSHDHGSLVSTFPTLLTVDTLLRQGGKRLHLQRLTRTGLGLLGLGFLMMWARYYGVLLLSTIAGIVTMIGIYRFPQSNWRTYWSQFCQLFRPAYRLLTIAVISGGLAAVGTYWMVSLVQSGENIWVSLSLILQNGGICAIAGLLLWQFLRHQTVQQQAYSDQLLTELTHEEALQRLIAVRKLTHLVLRSKVHSSNKTTAMILTRSQLAECFRLMLRSEAEPFVRNGLLDGLQQLDALES